MVIGVPILVLFIFIVSSWLMISGVRSIFFTGITIISVTKVIMGLVLLTLPVVVIVLIILSH